MTQARSRTILLSPASSRLLYLIISLPHEQRAYPPFTACGEGDNGNTTTGHTFHYIIASAAVAYQHNLRYSDFTILLALLSKLK